MISFNIEKAKIIAHNIRRANREKEFEPLDYLIAKQLPNVEFEQIEAKRQEIRNKYEVIQNKIDSSKNLDDLNAAIS